MSFENQLIGKDKYITVVSGNRKYLIEDFEDLNNCFVFATKETKASLKDLISSDYYKFESFENNKYIVFAEGFPIEEFKVFKVLRPEAIISTPFSFNNISSITPSALNNNFKAFENLCSIMQRLLNERIFKVDTTLADTMLPRLKANEVWKRSEDDTKYEAFNVGAIEENIASFWIAFEKFTKETILRIETIAKETIDNITNVADKNISDMNDIAKETIETVVQEGKDVIEEVDRIGDETIDKIQDSAIQVDSRLQTIWRMYSILTGTQRYLAGNVLSFRNPNKLDRTVNGGSLSGRVGEPRKKYIGNELKYRNIGGTN